MADFFGFDIGFGDILSTLLVVESVWNQIQGDKAAGSFADVLRESERRAWEQGKREHDAYLDYVAQYGGLSAANAAGRQDYFNQIAAAAREQDEIKRKMARRGLKQYRKGLRRARKQLRPFVRAGQAVAPLHAALYGSGAGGVQSLYDYMVQPQFMQQLEHTPGPLAQATKMPLPQYLHGGVK